MEKDILKKIEKKNLKDVVSENLRLSNIQEKHFVKEERFRRFPISTDEANVTELESKSVNSGKKILKGLRKILHREIRDWLVFPFQKKQSNFNKKILQNITEIYSEIDLHKQRHEKIMEQFESNLEQKIESIVDKNYSSLRKYFEVETKINEIFLKILGKLPDEKELKLYVNKIIDGEMELADLEDKLRIR